jgi:hypothetical protein
MDLRWKERVMSATKWAGFATACLLVTTSAASSLTQAATAPAPVAQMVLRVVKTPTSGPSREVATADVELAVGESKQLMFAASASLCESSIGGTLNRFGAPGHVWTVRFTLMSAQTDRIAVDVDTERQDDGAPNTRQAVRHLILTEGAPHVLDFVESSTPACAANLLIELSAAIVESATGTPQLLRYDLWLAHRDTSGREWTRHEVRTAPEGIRSEFRFEPLQWSTLALMPALKIDDVVEEHVFGSLRGRIVNGGQLELSVSTSRRLVHGRGSTGEESGTKVFTAGPGEAIALELPAAAGRSAATSAAGTRTFLNYQELFNGHTTAVVLTVNPLQGDKR